MQSIEEILDREDPRLPLVPGEKLTLDVRRTLPTIELGRSIASYRLLEFGAAGEATFRIEVRSYFGGPFATSTVALPLVVVIDRHGAVLSRTPILYELKPAGAFERPHLRGVWEGSLPEAGRYLVVLAAATDGVGDQLWQIESPAEPGRAISDWSEQWAKLCASPQGRFRVLLGLEESPTGPIGEGDT